MNCYMLCYMDSGKGNRCESLSNRQTINFNLRIFGGVHKLGVSMGTCLEHFFSIAYCLIYGSSINTV